MQAIVDFLSVFFLCFGIILFFVLKRKGKLQAHGVQLKNDSFFRVQLFGVLLAVAGLSRFLPFVFLHSPQACFLSRVRVRACSFVRVRIAFFSFGLFCLCFIYTPPPALENLKKSMLIFDLLYQLV